MAESRKYWNDKAKGQKMKAKYVGETFYDGLGLTDGKIYNIIKDKGSFYRVVDDSGEDYLYSKSNPAPLDGSSKGGKWELVN